MTAWSISAKAASLRGGILRGHWIGISPRLAQKALQVNPFLRVRPLAKEWRQGNAGFCQPARLSKPLTGPATGEVHRSLRSISTIVVQRVWFFLCVSVVELNPTLFRTPSP